MQVAQSNDTLKHYGILGMKWGVRRTPEQLGHGKKSSSSSKRTAAEAKEENNAKRKQKALSSTKAKDVRKGMDQLSDSELQQKLKRLNMEQQVRDLEKRQKSDAQVIVESVLKEVGREQLKSLMNYGINEGKKAVVKQVKKKTSAKKK